MKRSIAAVALLCVLVAACSSSSSKAAPPRTPESSAANPTTTTTVEQPEQTVPARTRYIVDGRAVDLICKGHGRVPVVFQAGGRENGVVWTNLISSLGPNVFTCVYNRPGTTAEEVAKPPTELMTPHIVAASLAGALRQAHVGPRVIVVGHSSGGMDALVFGNEYPSLVAGGVLFDPAEPNGVNDRDESKRIGFDADGAVKDTRAVKSWPDVPLVVLTADAHLAITNDGVTPADEREWIAIHRRWAHLSARGSEREIPGTSHFVYLTAPKVALATIRDVLSRAG